ncbi:Zinc transporter 7 [Smittium mucronatum]|uniref:Zinc transporter 7 n=1 Tax=Smittium mucronatum TaxID=133383 RepID=A0A1R0H038_9FUNG|nr:Zinc transporter 7 [Smittium mucronatum]
MLWMLFNIVVYISLLFTQQTSCFLNEDEKHNTSIDFTFVEDRWWNNSPPHHTKIKNHDRHAPEPPIILDTPDFVTFDTNHEEFLDALESNIFEKSETSSLTESSSEDLNTRTSTFIKAYTSGYPDFGDSTLSEELSNKVSSTVKSTLTGKISSKYSETVDSFISERSTDMESETESSTVEYWETEGNGSPIRDASCVLREPKCPLGFQLIILSIILFSGGIGVFIPILEYPLEMSYVSKVAVSLSKFFGFGMVLSVSLVHLYPPSVKHLSTSCIGSGPYSFLPLIIVMILFFVVVLYQFPVTDNNQDVDDSNQSGIGDVVDFGVKNRSQKTLYLVGKCISLHSLILGLSVGFIPKSEASMLSLAVAFVRLMEGFDVGSKLVSIRDSSYHQQIHPNERDLFLQSIGAVMFSLASPVAQCFGMAINPYLITNSKNYIVLLGILEGSSAGILLFISLVSFMIVHFHNLEFRTFPGWVKFLDFASMYAGASVFTVLYGYLQ